MSGEPTPTIIGNLTADPELRFLPSGIAVANFTVASTPRKKEGDEWVDGEAMFVRCTVWREYAENVAESLQKGERVIVTGRLGVQSYEAKDGSGTRVSIIMDVDEVGHSLRFGSSTFQRRGNGGGQQKSQRSSGRSSGRSSSRGNDDPWGGGGQSGPVDDPWASATEAPF